MRDRSENVFDGVDALMDEDLTHLFLFMSASWSNLSDCSSILAFWNFAVVRLDWLVNCVLSLLHDQVRLSEQHPRNASQCDEHQDLLDEALSSEHVNTAVLANRVGRLEQNHVDERDQDRWCAMNRVGQFVACTETVPLDEHQHCHVEEQEDEENHLRNEFGVNVSDVLEVAMVEESNDDAENHVNDSEDDRNFHLVSVLEDDLVQRSHLPHWIETDRVSAMEVVRRIQLQSLVGHDCAGVVVNLPTRAEDVKRLREDVVVDQSGVHREQSHQEDDVATAEENIPDLIVRLLSSQWFLLQHHPCTEESHDRTVTQVAEHNSEQEWESDDRVRSWIHLAIRCDTISVDEHLESVRELVGSIVSRRILESLHPVQDRRN